MSNFIKIILFPLFIFTYSLQLTAYSLFAQENEDETIIVNGDVVEYATEAKEVTATGNVSVFYKGVKLTCDKLTMNTQTKYGIAEGHARLDDAKGVIEGQRLEYDFQSKAAKISDADFRFTPYFGKTERLNKISDAEFIAHHGYMATCSYNNPHYRIKSRKIDLFPANQVKTKDDIFYVGRAPLMCFPQYNHNLKDPVMHVQMMPGKSKYWGPYYLSAWRYDLTEDVKGRIYFDYRAKVGVAEGFGVNYTSEGLGKGDYKFYYTQERDHNLVKTKSAPRIFERYLIRWRHQWDIDERTNLVSEYYKITDSKRILYPSGNYNFLKDYFFREYEKDARPLSYASLHHTFNYSSMDFLMQKRTNRWYAQEERLPEIKYSLPNFQIGETPLYFTNDSSYINYNYRNSVPSPSTDDITANKFNTLNKLSLPMKMAFINLTPFIAGQDIYSDKDTYGATSQIVFSTGTDMSTKFYRLFNVKSGFLGLDINKLRHIITPSIAYSYSKSSTTPAGKPRVGGGSSVGTSSASLGLSNKLQTKRNNQSVDVLDLNVTSSYSFKPKTGAKRGSSLSDIIYELKLLPYSWMRVDAATTYTHAGARSSVNYGNFSSASYDVNLDFGKEHSFTFGQRYQLKGGNTLNFKVDWRLSPKWRLVWYRRYERGHQPGLKRGLREQEYTISRDLHCWTWDINYNQKRGEGEAVWFAFRLNAFPELEFEFNRQYNVPKPGSQSNP